MPIPDPLMLKFIYTSTKQVMDTLANSIKNTAHVPAQTTIL